MTAESVSGAPVTRVGIHSSDLVQATGNAGLRGLTLVSKFLLVLMIARLFSPADMGLYGLMVSVLGLSVFALGLEYHYFSIRTLIRCPAERRPVILRDQALLYVLMTVFTLPLLALLLYSNTLNVLPRSVLGWYFALVVAELFAQEASIALFALSRPLQANLIIFVRSGAWVLPVIGMAVLYPAFLQLSNIFLAWLAGGLLSLALAAWFLRDLKWRFAFSERIDWQEIHAGLKTAAPFIIITGSSMGVLFLDRFIIEAFHGLGPVGVYTFFASITMGLHTLVHAGVSLVRMPRLVRAQEEKSSRKFHHEFAAMAKITVVSTIALAGILGVGVFPVLQFVGKEVYKDNIGIFFVLLVAVALRCLADVPLYGLYAKNRDLLLLLINLSAFGASLAVNLLLVPTYSIAGAAIAAVAGGATLLLSSVAANTRVGVRVLD